MILRHRLPGRVRARLKRCLERPNGRSSAHDHPDHHACRLGKVTRRMKPSLVSVLCITFLMSQAHAQGLLQTHRIPADLANQAVAAVVAKCASQGYAEDRKSVV